MSSLIVLQRQKAGHLLWVPRSINGAVRSTRSCRRLTWWQLSDWFITSSSTRLFSNPVKHHQTVRDMSKVHTTKYNVTQIHSYYLNQRHHHQQPIVSDVVKTQVNSKTQTRTKTFKHLWSYDIIIRSYGDHIISY